MQNYYQVMVPRLNGDRIKKDFAHYRALVKKGVAGFIIFGGELETVRACLKKLRNEAKLPLIISSDLERGLGQQLKGGTLFPPAMAMGEVYKKKLSAFSPQPSALSPQLSAFSPQSSALSLIKKSFRAVAKEAKYAGINTIYAPVLDINTNPKNPIIAVRAFGEDSNTVALLGSEMIRELQKNGIAACGKHFPGHGDTSVDSHIKLPVLMQNMRRLRQYELKPFTAAIESGVSMIMMGHLSVPAIDPDGVPVSFSKRATGFLRDDMGFSGLLVTDALNMGGIGRYSEEEASFMALEAGVDILLHPSDPGLIASYLKNRRPCFSSDRLVRFRKGLAGPADAEAPDFSANLGLSERLAAEAISESSRFSIKGSPLLVLLNDDEQEKGSLFAALMKEKFPGMRLVRLAQDMAGRVVKKPGEFMIVAVFSETRAWKGGAGSHLRRKIAQLAERTDLFVSFGSPYLLDGTGKIARMYVYWDSAQAEAAAAERLAQHIKT